MNKRGGRDPKSIKTRPFCKHGTEVKDSGILQLFEAIMGVGPAIDVKCGNCGQVFKAKENNNGD